MSNTPPLILLVEDEDDLAQIVTYHLQREGFESVRAATGAESFEYLQSQSVSLVLLDLMLPDMSGVEICRQIRSNENTQNLPVIMVTAKGEEIDRVVGFEVGADDYVVKPFSSRELILRIKALLRRHAPIDTDVNATNILEYSVFKIDQGAHRVWIAEDEIQLTALEFKLLGLLVARKGLVQTREVLLQDVWEMDPNVNTRTVDKHVQRLRQKIGIGADLIETIRGVGYRLRNDAS